MATSKLSEVIQQLRRAVLLREGADLTDAELLECFVSCHEAAALEALVRRHGPMVWGVCQRLLRNHHDARLRLLLVEETIRYVGPNRLRFHHNVVRSMIGGVEGFALKDKDSKHTATMDLEALRKSLKGYMADYDSNWRPFPNADRPLDLAHLRLIALVQDETTHEILQAAQVEIGAQRKAPAK